MVAPSTDFADSAQRVMTPSEAARQLHLGEYGTAALAELCPEGEKGCDAGILCALVIWLTEGLVELRARDRNVGSGASRRRSRPGLPIVTSVSRPKPIPDGVESLASTGSAEDRAGMEELPKMSPPSFKTRDLERLADQLKRAAGDLNVLFAGGLARRLLPQLGPSVLARTRPEQLVAYADQVIPLLLKRPSNTLEELAQEGAGPPTPGPTGHAADADELTGPPADQPHDDTRGTSQTRTSATNEQDAAETPGAGDRLGNPPTSGTEELSSEYDRQRGVRPRVKLNLRPLDSIAEALSGYEVRDLEPLQSRLTRLAYRLRRLHTTDDGAVVAKTFPAFIALPEHLEALVARLIPAMRAVQVGPKERPDFTRRLWSIFDYVHDKTGQYHDRQVALILDEAGLQFGPADVVTAERLPKWRAQHPRP